MSILIPAALFGWIPLTIFLFFHFKPHHAAMISVIGGILFLPVAGFNLPGLPPFTKNSVISIGLILGGRLSGARRTAAFRWSRYDLPMVVWCLCPLASSLSNNLGWYDGVSGVWGNISVWGVPYLAGRVYIDTAEKLHDLCMALVVGGLIYTPLCLYEIRMSPQLSNMVYDFFPHSFAQHRRYGGFRPIVFMQHGLMVSLWMATTTTTAFWLWRSRTLTDIKTIPFSFFLLAMMTTTILCKSANGWIALVLGCGGYFLFLLSRSTRSLRLLILLVPCYMMLRIGGVLEGGQIENLTSRIVDANRTASLAIRLVQEDFFIEKTLIAPIFGWGHIGRAWPRDDETGKKAVKMIDSLWLVIFSTKGLIGLLAMTTMMFIGPWRVLSPTRQQASAPIIPRAGPVVLCFVVLLFMMDSLVNGMINPVYVLVSGALLGWSLSQSVGTSNEPTL